MSKQAHRQTVAAEGLDPEMLGFQVWRKVERLRWWIFAMGIANAVALSLGIAALAAALATRPAGRTAEDVATSPTNDEQALGEALEGRQLSVAEAMQRAEAALLAIEPTGLTLATARSAEQMQAMWSEVYRKLLAGGEPVIFSGPCRPLTLQFAEGLSDQPREGWLRRCLVEMLAPDRGHGFHRALARKYNDERVLWHGERTLEATYNLSRDSNVRVDANLAWDTVAMDEYRRDLEVWEDLRFRAGAVPGPPPRMKQIPLWARRYGQGRW